MAFFNSVDIANRALQHCGVPQLDATLGFQELSQRANETKFAYGKIKRAELRDNVWRFATRRAAIRPIDTNTMLLAPALWGSATTYFVGSIVSDQTGFMWVSRLRDNLNNQPEQTPAAWEPYFGPLTVMLYDSSKSYLSGELVYTAAGDGTYNTFMSLVSANTLDPSLRNQWNVKTTYFRDQVAQQFPAWASGTTYSQGQGILYTDGNVYVSLIAGNVGNTPSSTSTVWALMPTLSLQTQTAPVTTPAPAAPQSSPIIEWVQGTVYSSGSFVIFNGAVWLSIASNNTGNFPTVAGSTFWVIVSNPLTYISLIDLNWGNSPSSFPTIWLIGTTYAINATAYDPLTGLIYTSLANGNVGNQPSLTPASWSTAGVLAPWGQLSNFVQGPGNPQWVQIGGAKFPAGVGLTTLNIIYPIGSGPVSQMETRNVYRLPASYLRVAPQDPQAGSVSYLGFPGYEMATDWTYEGNYITSRDTNVIVYRFVADVVDVTTFDDMFCEAMAAKLAKAVIPIFSQSTEKLNNIDRSYEKAMFEAKRTNGIEIGPVSPELDDFIACRY